MQAVRRIPGMLARVGFQVLRGGMGAQDGPGEDPDLGLAKSENRAMTGRRQ
jgi:hypothetical protein